MRLHKHYSFLFFVICVLLSIEKWHILEASPVSHSDTVVILDLPPINPFVQQQNAPDQLFIQLRRFLVKCYNPSCTTKIALKDLGLNPNQTPHPNTIGKELKKVFDKYIPKFTCDTVARLISFVEMKNCIDGKRPFPHFFKWNANGYDFYIIIGYKYSKDDTLKTNAKVYALELSSARKIWRSLNDSSVTAIGSILIYPKNDQTSILQMQSSRAKKIVITPHSSMNPYVLRPISNNHTRIMIYNSKGVCIHQGGLSDQLVLPKYGSGFYFFQGKNITTPSEVQMTGTMILVK